jgi:GT2 family glycosyltransferase
MIQLSVIIVNYNVRYFLEQCLHSVFRANETLNAEVFVVDNQSVDGSCAMVRDKFPDVKLIENDRNLGFSTANNQAIRLAKGKYILLLNPDTVVQEDTFVKVLKFMDEHPDAGGLGVKMIDGRGNYLPESKRGLPTPWVAFCKMTGLAALFPHSQQFGRYYLGYLSNIEVNPIDVLAGAFMLLRSETLEKTGLLDETFFMYGEDIDLSFRISLACYKNYFYPETTIIHYKGESTKKGSLNYVLVFYQAMIIFAQKHFSGAYARNLVIIIRIAVYLRALLAIFHRTSAAIAFPLTDAVFAISGFMILKPLWEKFQLQGGHYPADILLFALPVYLLIWLISISFSGGYEQPVRLGRIARGLLAGTVVILAGYSLLPESFRFSRGLILLSFSWNLIILSLWRIVAAFLRVPGVQLHSDKALNLIIVGRSEEARRVESLLKQTDIHFQLAGLVHPETEQRSEFLGNIRQLKEIVSVNAVDEIVFCSADIPARDIIATMHLLSDTRVSFKIAGPESLSVIGSNSIDTAGDLYSISNNSIGKNLNRRKKRLFDLGLSFVFALILPFVRPFFPSFSVVYRSLKEVIAGKKTWVGYEGTSGVILLPTIRKGVFSLARARSIQLSNETTEKFNLLYSKDYSILSDLKIVFRNLHHEQNCNNGNIPNKEKC